MSTSQRMPEIACKAPEAETVAWNRLSFITVRRHQRGQHLDLDLSASRAEQQEISVVFKLSLVYGTLLGQP